MKVRVSFKGQLICLLLLAISFVMGLVGRADVQKGRIISDFAVVGCGLASIVTVFTFVRLLCDVAGLSSGWRDRRRLVLAIGANMALLMLGAGAVYVNAANLRASYSNRANIVERVGHSAAQGSAEAALHDTWKCPLGNGHGHIEYALLSPLAGFLGNGGTPNPLRCTVGSIP